MAIDEGSRHRMYLKLEEVLGAEEAETLMEHLPPVGWADVATKRDLDHLRVELALELRGDMKDLALSFERELRSLTLKILAGVTAIAGIALTIARLT
jgi:hypothetical protein